MIKQGGSRAGMGMITAVAAVLAALGAEPGFAREAGQAIIEARQAVEQSALSAEEKLRIQGGMEKSLAAGVPADDTAIIITRSLGRGEAAAAASSLETVARLKQQGLPVRLALDRIEQGLAKNVPGERISSMVEKLSGHIEQARPLVEGLTGKGIVDPEQRDQATETVARAYEKEIPADAVAAAGEQVRQHKGSTELFNRSVDTMTTFAGNGMQAAEASRLVQRALERGYSERDLTAMERYMVEELRKNRPVRDIVSGMESRMERGGMRGGADRQGGGTVREPGSGRAGNSPGMGGRR